jgi:hypothetical protein
MAAIYNFLRTYEVLMYILLAIGGLFAFRWLWRSWRESQTAVYTWNANSHPAAWRNLPQSRL